jgi:methylamine dehydrogenase accessory protein MauD
MRRVLILLSTAVFVSTSTVRSVHAQESGIAVGSRAPAVEVHDLEGKPVALGRYLGKKPVFLEFWATWCELCEQLLPRVKAAKSAYGDKVEFIGINVTVNQSPDKVRRYVDKHQPGYLVLYDDQGTSIRAYQVPSTSYVVIVDREGKVAYTGLGGTQEFDAVLRRVTQG